MQVFAGTGVDNTLRSFLKRSKWIAAITAAILSCFLVAQNAFAAEITWDNGSLVYNNKKYEGPKTVNENSTLDLEKGTQYFENKEGNKADIIYFAPGTNIQDAQNAQHATYNIDNRGQYVADGQPQELQVDSSGAKNRDGNTTSCAVNGIGYILCPIMGFLASGMDHIYSLLEEFLQVRTITADKDNSLHQAWMIVQAIANITFIIIFLIIIYSEVTGRGLNNSLVKTMLPRLIVGAVLVNISYYVCAVLVDISNVIGNSLQTMLMQIRDQLISSQTTNKLNNFSWEAITTYILSGGTIAAAGFTVATSGIMGTVFLLVPALTSAFVAVIVTVAVLAARQALIIVLIVISPLAFALRIHPGTDKYFDKWKNLFSVMLLMYPAFSLLFGGSQLAGYLIAQNTDNPTTVLLAMFVQAAPLIITPFLIKFSGNLLGRFAGMVNNPTRGVVDRTNNWARNRANVRRMERLGGAKTGTGLARWLDQQGRADKLKLANQEDKLNTRFFQAKTGQALMMESMREKDRHQAVSNINTSRYHEMQLSDSRMRAQLLQNKLAESTMTMNQARTSAYVDEMRTEKGAKMREEASPVFHDLSSELARVDQLQRATDGRAKLAKITQTIQYSKDLIDPKHADILEESAGILGDDGKILSAAEATVNMRSDFAKNSAAITEIMNHVHMSGGDIEKLAKREGSVSLGGFTFDHQNEYVLDAAVDKFLNEKATATQRLEFMVDYSGKDEYVGSRKTMSSTLMSKMLTDYPYLKGKAIDRLETTGFRDAEQIKEYARDYVSKGKATTGSLANMSDNGLRILYNAISDGSTVGVSEEKMATYRDEVRGLVRLANEAYNDPRLQNVISNNARSELEKIKDLHFFKY